MYFNKLFLRDLVINSVRACNLFILNWHHQLYHWLIDCRSIDWKLSLFTNKSEGSLEVAVASVVGDPGQVDLSAHRRWGYSHRVVLIFRYWVTRQFCLLIVLIWSVQPKPPAIAIIRQNGLSSVALQGLPRSLWQPCYGRSGESRWWVADHRHVSIPASAMAAVRLWPWYKF